MLWKLGDQACDLLRGLLVLAELLFKVLEHRQIIRLDETLDAFADVRAVVALAERLILRARSPDGRFVRLIRVRESLQGRKVRLAVALCQFLVRVERLCGSLIFLLVRLSGRERDVLLLRSACKRLHRLFCRVDLRLVRFFDLVPRRELLDGRLRVLDDGFAVGQKRHLPDAASKLFRRAGLQERRLLAGELAIGRVRLLDALAVLGIVELRRVVRELIDQVLHFLGRFRALIVRLTRGLEVLDKIVVEIFLYVFVLRSLVVGLLRLFDDSERVLFDLVRVGGSLLHLLVDDFRLLDVGDVCRKLVIGLTRL